MILEAEISFFRLARGPKETARSQAGRPEIVAEAHAEGRICESCHFHADPASALCAEENKHGDTAPWLQRWRACHAVRLM